MAKTHSLTQGNILGTLIRFAVPVFFTLFLQALYGGVDLLVVGQFASTADVSGVATGNMLLSTVTMIITGLSMGITILVGERIGSQRPKEAGRAIGSGICLFIVFGILLALIMIGGAGFLANALHAPAEAFDQTCHYIAICGGGSLFIIAYNVLGAVFRGIGDSKTPLLTVMIACVVNICGDLLLVAVFHMGAAGAAIATVAAQAVSVIISLAVIRKRQLPFEFSRKFIRFDKEYHPYGNPSGGSGGSPGAAGRDLLSGDPDYCKYFRCSRFCGSRRGRKSLYLYHAGAFRLYAVYVCFRCPEHGGRESSPGQKSPGIRSPDRFYSRRDHGDPDLFPRGRYGLYLFQGSCRHCRRSQLSEGLCHRLYAHPLPFLLYRLLKRLRENYVCYDPGYRRRLPGEDPCSISGQPDTGSHSFPDRPWHSRLQPGPDHPLPAYVCVPGKKVKKNLKI